MYKKQNKVRILIPNATSPKNIGDLAMLVSLIDLINKSIDNAYITVHSTDPSLHDKKIADKPVEYKNELCERLSHSLLG